ncbi:MAG: damage-inducible protein DinB [Pleurocapsa sp. SU_196_0]|nr:damage-inducible protein DinB [Pleurocapsa sp. SU_196_0]
MNNPAIFTPSSLLEHWQGHQRLTRVTIERFPAEHLFSFQPAAPMRSYGAMMLEVVGMVQPILNGVETGQFNWGNTQPDIHSKTALLEAWDANTDFITAAFSRIAGERWLARAAEFGIEQPVVDYVLYQVDNEIHHRATGHGVPASAGTRAATVRGTLNAGIVISSQK